MPPATVPFGFALSARARRARSSTIRELLRYAERPGLLSLAGGLPPPEALPTDAVAAAIDAALARTGPTGPPALQYGPTEGCEALRAAVAGWWHERGRNVELDDVLITTGSQQALALAAQVLVDPGDPVVVEAPGYLGALQAFEAVGAELVAVPVDGDGLDTEHLAARLNEGLRPRACVVVPSFQNPTGASLSPARRAHLHELAARHGFVVVEDDPYGELGFDAAAAPVAAEDGDAAVLAIASASKTTAPGLRVGWATGPRWLLAAMATAKQAADLHTPTLNQLVVAALLTDTTTQAAHVARVRALYRQRADALAAAIATTDGRLQARPARGGMFCWARAEGVDTVALLTTALERGVAFVPGAAFVAGDAAHALDVRAHMRLCFASLPPDALAEAVGRLDRAVREAAAAS